MTQLTEGAGTYKVYLPPEIHRLESEKKAGKKPTPYDGFKADVFSFGATLFAFIFNLPCFTFSIPEKDESYEKIAKGEWDHVWERPSVKANLDEFELQNSSQLEDLKLLF